MWVRFGTIYLIGCKMVVTSFDRNFLFGSGHDEPGASGGHLSPEVLGLVSSGSVPVVGS